jgi:hypothetical protein
MKDKLLNSEHEQNTSNFSGTSLALVEQSDISIYVSIYLPTYLPTYLSVCLSVYGSTVLLLDFRRFFSFLIYTQQLRLLGRGISPLPTQDNTNRINEIQICMP